MTRPIYICKHIFAEPDQEVWKFKDKDEIDLAVCSYCKKMVMFGIQIERNRNKKADDMCLIPFIMLRA